MSFTPEERVRMKSIQRAAARLHDITSGDYADAIHGVGLAATAMLVANRSITDIEDRVPVQALWDGLVTHTPELLDQVAAAATDLAVAFRAEAAAHA